MCCYNVLGLVFGRGDGESLYGTPTAERAICMAAPHAPIIGAGEEGSGCRFKQGDGGGVKVGQREGRAVVNLNFIIFRPGERVPGEGNCRLEVIVCGRGDSGRRDDL